MSGALRIVAKIGTSSVTDARGALRVDAIDRLCDEAAVLRREGHEVLVVTSGAVAGGVGALGLAARPTEVLTLQALSAVGQSRLMSLYDAALARHGLVGAQALLVPHDFVDRTQYLHARATLLRLLELGCVPVINENDAIASDEIRYGDNDHIAALVAHAVAADVLVLLTDTRGLFTADPARDASARFVERVEADDPLLSVRAGDSAGERGSGGMASKLAAARIASWSGVRTVIAEAGRAGVLRDAVAGTPGVGTQFVAHDRSLPARKLWIAFAARPAGVLVVDEGARGALARRGSSLLHAGVVEVRGDFAAGDAVEVHDGAGALVARGIAAVSADDARAARGRRSGELAEGLPAEVIHRDDLVLLAD
jgi:glutamate 5-kinase